MTRDTGSARPRRCLARIVACMLIPLAAASLPAAEAAGSDNAVEVLTLEQALAITLENNRDIRNAMELRRKLEGKYVEERAAALPQLLVTASAVWSGDESQKAFFGTSRNDVYQAQAGVSQPLFTYGQIGAAIRAARVGLATADDQLRIFRQAGIRDVSAAFYDVLLARELHLIALESRGQKERLLDEAQKKRTAGTATDYDVLAAEVGVRNAGPPVIRAENLVRTARERLRFLLGRDGREVDVRGELAAEIGEYPRYEEALATAWKRRPELSDLRNRIGISEELITIARAGDKPRLDLNAAVGWKENDIGIADASGSTWSAGLFLTWPLFNGLRTRGQVAQAQSDRMTLRIEEAKLLDSVALECRDAVNAVRVAGEIVKGQSGTAAQAERLLLMAEKGYEYGVKTKLEVDDAQLNLTQARGSLAAARRDYLVAQVNLGQATGTLGEEGGVAPAMDPKAFRPAGSPLGIVREVLTGEPRLERRP